MAPPSGPFAARGPLNICHGPQGGHLAKFGKPWFTLKERTIKIFLPKRYCIYKLLPLELKILSLI